MGNFQIMNLISLIVIDLFRIPLSSSVGFGHFNLKVFFFPFHICFQTYWRISFLTFLHYFYLCRICSHVPSFTPYIGNLWFSFFSLPLISPKRVLSIFIDIFKNQFITSLFFHFFHFIYFPF